MFTLNNLLLSTSFFNATNTFIIVGILILLLCSAFFSSSEIAFSSANKVRIRMYAEENKRGARKALYIQEHFDKALSTILVGNNFVNILSTTLTGYLFISIIKNPVLYNIVNTVLMTIIILIFGEIIPKAWAKSKPEKVALFVAPILFAVMKITYVFCVPFNLLQKAFIKKGSKKTMPTMTEDELENIVEAMEDEGVLDEQNADIIYGALKFNDVAVKDIMTPRVDVICASISTSNEDLKDLFLTHQYSRIPIYKKSMDNIVGILNQKDFFSAIIGKDKIKLEEMLTQPIYVSKTAKINNVMRLMQHEKKHMAIVTDEYGGTSGIVTMEDCFEEVFGEVYDEHDDSIVTTISTIEENKHKVNANLSVEELFDYLQIEKMPKNKYSTLSTFLSELMKKVPQEGNVVNYKTVDEIINEDSEFVKKEINLLFKLSKVEKRRIKEVELTVSYN